MACTEATTIGLASSMAGPLGISLFSLTNRGCLCHSRWNENHQHGLFHLLRRPTHSWRATRFLMALRLIRFLRIMTLFELYFLFCFPTAYLTCQHFVSWSCSIAHGCFSFPFVQTAFTAAGTATTPELALPAALFAKAAACRLRFFKLIFKPLSAFGFCSWLQVPRGRLHQYSIFGIAHHEIQGPPCFECFSPSGHLSL